MQKSLLNDIQEQKEELRTNAVKELGIFELRGLARELGIHSPTTRKRGELVDLILEKLSTGVIGNPVKKTNKGRPCKSLKNIDEIMNIMAGSDETSSIVTATKRIRPYEEVVTFAQELPVFGLVQEPRISKFEGVLRIASKVGYFLDRRNGTKVFVSMEMIDKNKLSLGDYLHVEASKINTSNQYIVEKIEKINFVEIDQYKTIENLDKQPVISFDVVDYGSYKIFRGRRNVICYQKNLFEDDRFVRFAENLVNMGYKVVVLGLNTCFEDTIMFNNTKGIINLSTGYGESYQVGLDKAVDAISLVSRLNERGEKVMLFISDVIGLLNSLDLCFEAKEKINGHSAEAVVIAQKLVSLGRAYNDGSEITVVMTYRDYDKDDNFLINEVFKVSTKFE